MHTAFFLMARYNASPVIPLDVVVKDYFLHLATQVFVRKVSMGDIDIPLIRIDGDSQKSVKGVHVAQTTSIAIHSSKIDPTKLSQKD